MIKPELMAKINDALAEACSKHGLVGDLKVEDFYDACCIVPIPREVANEQYEATLAVCDELRKIPEIHDIWDRGVGEIIRGDAIRQYEITVKRGHWVHTKEDDERISVYTREYTDPEYHAQREAERMAKRRERWQEYLMPLPKPDGNPNTELYLTMAYEPYDWIDKGYDEGGKHLFKRTEFRAYSEYYNRKLLSHPIKTVKFQRGYGGPGRGKPSQMCFEVKSINICDMHQHLECDPRAPIHGIVPQFFAINLGERLS